MADIKKETLQFCEEGCCGLKKIKIKDMVEIIAKMSNISTSFSLKDYLFKTIHTEGNGLDFHTFICDLTNKNGNSKEDKSIKAFKFLNYVNNSNMSEKIKKEIFSKELIENIFNLQTQVQTESKQFKLNKSYIKLLNCFVEKNQNSDDSQAITNIVNNILKENKTPSKTPVGELKEQNNKIITETVKNVIETFHNNKKLDLETVNNNIENCLNSQVKINNSENNSVSTNSLDNSSVESNKEEAIKPVTLQAPRVQVQQSVKQNNAIEQNNVVKTVQDLLLAFDDECKQETNISKQFEIIKAKEEFRALSMAQLNSNYKEKEDKLQQCIKDLKAQGTKITTNNYKIEYSKNLANINNTAVFKNRNFVTKIFTKKEQEANYQTAKTINLMTTATEVVKVYCNYKQTKQQLSITKNRIQSKSFLSKMFYFLFPDYREQTKAKKIAKNELQQYKNTPAYNLLKKSQQQVNTKAKKNINYTNQLIDINNKKLELEQKINSEQVQDLKKIFIKTQTQTKTTSSPIDKYNQIQQLYVKSIKNKVNSKLQNTESFGDALLELEQQLNAQFNAIKTA